MSFKNRLYFKNFYKKSKLLYFYTKKYFLFKFKRNLKEFPYEFFFFILLRTLEYCVIISEFIIKTKNCFKLIAINACFSSLKPLRKGNIPRNAQIIISYRMSLKDSNSLQVFTSKRYVGKVDGKSV